jgi:hypothetical protein
MTEDGFLIIKHASISFESIKGYEKLLRSSNQDEGYLIHEQHGQNLSTGDRIYDISGRLFRRQTSLSTSPSFRQKL